MATDSVTITFGGEDGERVFSNSVQLREWAVEQQNAWRWLNNSAVPKDRNNIVSGIQNGLAETLQVIDAHRGQPLNRMSGALNGIWNQDQASKLRHTGSQLYGVIEDIRASSNDRVAAWAYAFATKIVSLQQCTDPEHVKGVFLVTFPEWGLPAELAERLGKERSNFREGLRKAEHAHLDALKTIEKEARSTEARLRTMAVRRLRERVRRWRRHQDFRSKESQSAIASLKSTEQSYVDFMKLRGPVQYWQEKASRHRAASVNSAIALGLFFVVTLVAIIASASPAINFVTKEDDLSTPASVLIAAAFAAGLTILFWMGRILGRIYLSERHLALDAEERVVMTTAYLAFLNDGTADASDRHLVLAALFRPSTDGIVHDDGVPAFTPASILSGQLSGQGRA